MPDKLPPPSDASAEAFLVDMPKIETLRKRPDFLRAAQARRVPMPGFLLQVRARTSAEPPGATIRIGFTCSKKVGNAVARNRAKRRLRELARAVLPSEGLPGHDYVLIGRREITATRPMGQLCDDLRRALQKVHGS